MTSAALRLSPEPANPPLLVFGGTFDPVHLGHLGAVSALRDALQVETVIWLPAGEPPHRPAPGASAAHRLAMLQLALAEQADCVIDTRELERSGPSYTVLSLEELRAEYPDQPLCLALGLDAALGLTKWHRWRDVLALAGIAVAASAKDNGKSAPCFGPQRLQRRFQRVGCMGIVHNHSGTGRMA